ncbi:MAG TPA: ornithine carbamoyltransferase [Candidatus Nanoarchaeia archaeon]|nr:ornithine carbamoyltransferase [Candidatus Nanoarchaeia archaeon]
MANILSINDLSLDEINELLDVADDLKAKRAKGMVVEMLKSKSLAMVFEKSSTRTRLSFEVAMAELGGHALYLNYHDLQLGRGETVGDTAQVMSRYVHAIMARVNSHKTLQEMAKYASVPVINGLSDIEHPCQLLADLQTIREYKGKFEGLKLAWIGDGNNVCNSAILAAAITGMEINVACPEGYEPNDDIVQKARDMGGNVKIVRSPQDAAENADVLYTDVWISMGDDDEREQRMFDLKNYQINEALVDIAKDDCMVLHCLPAHRGEEITSEVLTGPYSAILDEAENRLHAQKALLIKLLGSK